MQRSIERWPGEEGRSIVEEKTWPTRDGSHVLHVSFPSIVIFHFYKNPFDDVHVNRQISRSKKFFCSKFLAKFLINAIKSLSRNLIKGRDYSFDAYYIFRDSLYSFSSVEIIIIIMKFEKVGRVPPPPQHLSSCRWFTVKEDEGRTLWLDTQSHASSSASSADDDYTWQWPTSFWSQFKVSITFSKFLILAGEQHTVCSDWLIPSETRD